MIAKKEWDALPLKTKREILTIVFGEDFERFPPKALLYEYRHNFDFDDTGKRLKKVLKQCYRTEDGNINVHVDVQVSKIDKVFFLPTPTPPKKVKASQPTVSKPVEKKHWQVDYNDKSGDLSHVHCYAYTKDDARDYCLHEYWDIKEIIQICEIK